MHAMPLMIVRAVLPGDRLSLLQRVSGGEGGGARRLAHDAGLRVQRRAELSPHAQMGAVRPSLRGDLRRGAADRAGAGDSVRLPAGLDLDRGRRLPGRGRARHAGAGRQRAPRRPLAGRNRAGRNRHRWPARRRRSRFCSSWSSPCRAWAWWSSKRSAAKKSSWPPARCSTLPERADARTVGPTATATIARDAGRHARSRTPTAPRSRAARRSRSPSRTRRCGREPARPSRPTPTNSSRCPTGVTQAVPGSSWGTFTIACTIPIALFVGLYMYKIRKGRVVEASADRRGGRAGRHGGRQLDSRLAAGAVFLAVARAARSWRSASMASSPRCCRCGCCSARAIICRAF